MGTPKIHPNLGHPAKFGGKSNSRIFLIGPQIVDPIGAPLTLEWGQIAARSLRRWLGDDSPRKFGQKENFRPTTINGFAARGKIDDFLGAKLGVF